MPRLGKSKAPTDPTPPPDTPPPELVQQLTSQRDYRALAASSTAIALSIGSAFYGTCGTPSDGAATREMDAGWQTAYAAFRTAVEITKESSDLFLPLKAVVGAISVLIKNHDQTLDNAEKVKDIERRVHSLSGVLASPIGEDDYAEKGRRVEFRRKLEGVIAKLEPLSDQHALVRFLRNIDIAKTLGGFVQELADAITDYQVSVQQGVYERTREIYDDTKNVHGETKEIRNDTKNIRGDTENIRDDTRNILEAADLDILAKLEPVRNAGYQAGHHEKCLLGTRESVLRDILLWAKNPREQNVFWLNGLAGTGKSTIAQSFSEAVTADGSLGASFFCSRDYFDRRELKNIFPTLAYQLAYRYPHFRNHIVTSIKKDPTLTHASLISQLENLLINPLSTKDTPCVIVIDALDECIDDQPSSAILSVLGQFVKRVPLVKFFVTGRPEPRIRSGFRLPLLEPLTHIFLLHEVELSRVDDDIRLYLTQRLTEVSKRRSDLDLSNPWPHDNEIEALTKKSSGLFIFAATLVRFVASEHHQPNERLQLVLSKGSGTTHEGRTGIDSLYSQVLLHAFSDVREEAVFSDVKRVLAAIVLAFVPLSRRELSRILCIPASTIRTTLRHLHSVVLVPDDETKKIRVFHKSFPDFLQNTRRCTDPRFHINPVARHGDIVLSCLELVKKVGRNHCSLPHFTMNRDVHELPQLLEDKLGGAVRYACSYWARHLRLSPNSGKHVLPVIASAIGMLRSAPPWIEVMSLEGRLEDVIHSMYGLLAWQDKVDSMTKQEAERGGVTLYDLATDCLRLSMHFFHPIQQCAQQVYHTALPLSPTSSLLRNSYAQNVIDNQLSRATAFLRAPYEWGLLLRTINVRPGRLMCIATSGQSIVAACEDVTNVYDAVTLVLQQSLRIPETITKIKGSPDGSTLFFAHSHSVTMWDVQTGGLTHTFTVRSEINDIAVSTMGDHIACGSSDGSVTFWNTNTKGEGEGFGNGQPVVAILWLSPWKLAVATQGTVYTHDIGYGETLGSFSIPGRVWGLVYSPFGGSEFLVGTLQPGEGAGWNSSFLRITASKQEHTPETFESKPLSMRPLGRPGEGLSRPMLAGGVVVWITLPRGVRSFDVGSWDSMGNIPLLDTATSVAVSMNRNIVAQIGDSLQIFTFDVLKNREARNDACTSHVYPLGEKHIVCLLQPDRHLTILELETLRKLHPNDYTSLLVSLPTNQPPSARASFSRGLVAEFSIQVVIQAWRSGTPLPEWAEGADDDPPLSGLSPDCARIVTFYGSPRWELHVKDTKDETTLANLPLGEDGLEMGEVYDVIFDSATRFHLKIDGPGQQVQIPYDIVPSTSGSHSHTITKGEPVPLSEPRAIPPYKLDANCEWVVDAKSRKICWVSQGNVRRGNGGHFWAGLELVMVGDEGVVRKISFREPDS